VHPKESSCVLARCTCRRMDDQQPGDGLNVRCSLAREVPSNNMLALKALPAMIVTQLVNIILTTIDVSSSGCFEASIHVAALCLNTARCLCVYLTCLPVVYLCCLSLHLREGLARAEAQATRLFVSIHSLSLPRWLLQQWWGSILDAAAAAGR
jgi:hypothetical protein